jgi:hypothetical protein
VVRNIYTGNFTADTQGLGHAPVKLTIADGYGAGYVFRLSGVCNTTAYSIDSDVFAIETYVAGNSMLLSRMTDCPRLTPVWYRILEDPRQFHCLFHWSHCQFEVGYWNRIRCCHWVRRM